MAKGPHLKGTALFMSSFPALADLDLVLRMLGQGSYAAPQTCLKRPLDRRLP